MRRSIAILIFDDVEVLDFAGPLEVFSVTDELAGRTLFNVFTVAESPATVIARNGLKVVPSHTFESAPAPGILVVPGGLGTRALLKKPSVIEWIRTRSRKSEHTISVCTGSLLLAKTGLLDGQEATTHCSQFDLLRELAPTAAVCEDRRFTDSGRILTSAGISAGIDMSLHLVARLHGVAIAQKTADHMEYHWRDDGGVTR